MGTLLILIFALGICYLIANTGDDSPLAVYGLYGVLILVPGIIIYIISRLIYCIIL